MSDYDELVQRLQAGHDSQCAMSYGMHEHCCDCSYVDRQDAADAITALQARVAELERELTLEEQRVADMMADVNRVGHANDALRQDLAAAQALLREARDFTPGAWITGGATSLRQRIDTALFKDFAETKRARDLAYMNGYEVAKEEYRELLHKAEDDLAAARALLAEARESWIKVGYGASHEDVADCSDLCRRIDAAIAGKDRT